MEDNLQKWFTLLEQVEVVHRRDPKMHTITLEQIEQFESQSGFILPQEYKEYCQVFGSGIFGITLLRVYCPDHLNVEEHLISLQDAINACVDFSDYTEEEKQIFESAYVFGYGADYTLFIFDSKTYSSEDKSVNIYGISELDTIYFIGRSFYEFVRDVCMGDKAETCFPELVEGVDPESDLQDPISGSRTFRPG
ncbi:MAG: SMI1/KNR4 family protein [Cyanobacteria bacterium P01_C01_bin.72]